ncbi:MAG TPA: cadmium resistance transporter [Pseudonocardiaceae bacterium]|nr:cadmium resistance transporter [Pseudonocardiaceae bacterium]
MDHLAAVVATAVVAFVGTNMDDFVVLLLLVLGTARDQTAWHQIVIGQYIGFCVLLVAGLAGAALFGLIGTQWIAVLGALPIALGLNGFRRAIRHSDDQPNDNRFTGGVLQVAVVTVANGGDNISVYTPLYRELTAGSKVIASGAMLVMLGIWCAAALIVGHHARLIPGIVKIGRWLTPSVYVVIGVLVVLRAAVWHDGPL